MCIPNSSKFIPTGSFYCPVFNKCFFPCTACLYYNHKKLLNYRSSTPKNNMISPYLFRFAPLAYVTDWDINRVLVINILTKSVLQAIPVGTHPISIAMKPSSFYAFLAYVTNMLDGTISVIDTTTNKVISTIHVGGRPYGIAISPDGYKAYVTSSGSGNIKIAVIDTITNTVTAEIETGVTSQIVASPDGSKVYAALYSINQVLVIDTKTNNIIKKINIAKGSAFDGMAITPDGSKVYVTSSDGSSISVIDTSTDTFSVIPVGARTNGIAVTPNGCYVYVVVPDNGDVLVIDIATDKIVKVITVANAPKRIALTSDGTRAYVTHQYNKISVIDTTTNEALSPIATDFKSYGISIIPLSI